LFGSNIRKRTVENQEIDKQKRTDQERTSILSWWKWEIVYP